LTCPPTRLLILTTEVARTNFPDYMQTANLAFASVKEACNNSDLVEFGSKIQLVGIESLFSNEFTETGVYATDMTSILAPNSRPRQLRAQYQADLVMILTDEFEDNPYRGAVATFGDYTSSGDSAFAVVETQSAILPTYTFAHEFGHLFGARHQKSTNCFTGHDNSGLDWAHGHAFSKGWSEWEKFYRTIVSGCGTPLKRVVIKHYSNPDVEYRNKKTGVEDEADNARVLHNATCRIGNYIQNSEISVLFTGSGFGCPGETTNLMANVVGAPGPYVYNWQISINNGTWWTEAPTNPSVLPLTLSSNPGDIICISLTVTANEAASTTISDTYSRCIEVMDCGERPSGERLGQNQSTTESEIKVYPNPANDHLIINIPKTGHSIQKISIVNFTGQILLERPVLMDELYMNEFRIPLSEIDSGTYLLKLYGSDDIKPIVFSVIH
jgi:hypothetical protein